MSDEEKPKKHWHFQKGKSGNPGGRPKEIRDLATIARKYTQEALDILVRIMRDCEKANPKAAAFAADKLLDRAWGKAPQSIYITRNTRPTEVDEETLERIATGRSEGTSEPSESPEEPPNFH